MTKGKLRNLAEKSAVPIATLAPGFGIFPRAMDAISAGYQQPAIGAAGTFLAAFLLATDQYLKYVPNKSHSTSPIENGDASDFETVDYPIEQTKYIKWKGPKEPFTLWGQHFKLQDFMTSCMIVGTTGTGKTSAGFDLFLDSMTRMLDDEDPKSKRAKFGGFFLDVKNQFFIRLIYFMARSGRNPLTDLKVISPYSQKIATQWEDPDTGYYFYMNASHFPTGTASNNFLQSKPLPNDASYPENLFSVYTSKYEEYYEQLRGCVLDTEGRPLNLIGWRPRGNKLLRVVRNSGLDQIQVYKRSGKRLLINPPKRLRFIRRVMIESGLRYNMIDNDLPAPAISQQLMKVARLANGSGGNSGGNDSYWIGSTESQVTNCINLWRLIHGVSKEITGPDILKLTTNQEFLDGYLRELKEMNRKLTSEILEQEEQDDRMRLQELKDKAKSIDAVSDYFVQTWAQKDVKQKGTVEQMITNLFSIFNSDEHLKRSFCSTSTYHFRETMNDGKVFVLVPGAEYSETAKIIGTLLKLHFQKVGLERVDSPTINRNRTVIFGADEVQRYVVAANASEGDPDFNNLSRESKIINIVATQTDASITDLIKGAADSYFSSFGVRLYFNVDDANTRKRGMELCARTTKKSEYKRKGQDITLTDLMEGKGSISAEHSDKEEKTIKLEDFGDLKLWQSICYNKFAPDHNKPIAVKHQNEPHEYGDDTKGHMIVALVDWYQTGVMEQALFEQGEVDFVSHDSHLAGENTNTEEPPEDAEEFEEETTNGKMTASGGTGGGPLKKNPDPETAFGQEGSFDDALDSEPDPIDQELPIPHQIARPRSPVGGKVHKGGVGEIPHGTPAPQEPTLFADDPGPGTEEAPGTKFEGTMSNGTDDETSNISQEKEVGADTHAMKITKAVALQMSDSEANSHYGNDYDYEVAYLNALNSSEAYSTPDSVVTGKAGYASDKDDGLRKSGMGILSAEKISPSKPISPTPKWEGFRESEKSKKAPSEIGYNEDDKTQEPPKGKTSIEV